MRVTIALVLTLLAVACTAPEQEAQMSDIDARLAKYAQVQMPSIPDGLSESQEAALRKLLEAARLMDQAFWRQAGADGAELLESLEASGSAGDAKLARYVRINKGRFDRLAANEPFIGSEPKPAGAAFWPEDLTREELEAYVAARPEEREALYSLTTVVQRDGDRLIAIPYREHYARFVRPAAELLAEAAELAENESLKRYLQLRSSALLSDDYLESDMAWMDLEGNTLDIVIGAIEPYEDALMNLKGGFEAFVLVKDEAASRELEAYIDAMDDMQAALPVAEAFKSRAVRLGSSVGVFTLVYAGGDGDAGSKTIAISLPNDERVRESKGTRKIMLRNAIAAKYEKILTRIAERLLAPELMELVDGDVFFNNILLHEIAHSLGNDFVLDSEGNRTETKIDVALMNHSAALEEAKADIGGLYSTGVLVSRGVLPAELQASHYATFLAGIFRSVRFGASSAHGVANAIELNWMLESGAISIGDDGLWRMDEAKFAAAVEALLAELLTIQHKGDYERAAALVENFGALPEALTEQLAKMSDIPVDIEYVWQ